MGLVFSILLFFRTLGIALLEVFLLPVKAAQWLLAPLGNDVLATLGLAPGELQPQIAIVLSIVGWSALIISLAVLWQRVLDGVHLLRTRAVGLVFRVRMRSRFQAGWVHRVLERFLGKPQEDRDTAEFSLEPEAMEILRATSAKGELSTREIADLLGLPTQQAKVHIAKLRQLDLLEAISSARKEAARYCVSHPGSMLLSLWSSSAAR